MCHKTGNPRYDDTSSIDSNAAAPRQAPAKNQRPPMDDPTATAYTEMYCAPTNAIDPQPTPKKQ